LYKQRKKNIIAWNRLKGKEFEDTVAMSHTLRGEEVVRTGRGHDFKIRQRDPFTGRVIRTYYEEVKSSSTAPLSKLQKKMKKKKNVRVVRPWIDL